MFCPQCGLQQLSDEVRFCPRCGLQLKGVAVLLAGGGEFPSSVMVAGSGEISPRRKGVRQGGKVMLFGVFLSLMFEILHDLIHTSADLSLIGALVFVLGLLRLVYALCFEDGAIRQQKTSTQFVYVPPKSAANSFAHGRAAAAELPPAQSIPAGGYVAPRMNTAEIRYRPSVTENTTRLLDDQDDSSTR